MKRHCFCRFSELFGAYRRLFPNKGDVNWTSQVKKWHVIVGRVVPTCEQLRQLKLQAAAWRLESRDLRDGPGSCLGGSTSLCSPGLICFKRSLILFNGKSLFWECR